QILNRLYMLRQQRASLAARLNTLMDLEPQTEIPPVRLADPPLGAVATLDLAGLFATGAEHRHEVRAADARIERSDRSITLAKRSYWPDLMIGAGLINVGRFEAPGMTTPPDSGKNAWTVSVGVSIPI